MRASLCLLVAAALLSACASKPLPPPWREAGPQAWGQATVSMAAPQDASAVEPWWKQLRDPQLNQLIDQALTGNTDVRVLAARLKRAQATAEVASAARRPQLDLGTSAAREQVQKSTVRDTEGASVSTPAFRQSRVNMQVEGRYEVDVMGRLALGEQATALERAASAADVQAVRQWLALEVVVTYADMRLADDRIAASQVSADLIEQLLQAERQRLAAGLTGRDSVRVIERQRAEKWDEQAELKRQRSAATTTLAGLMGLAPVQLALTLAHHEPWLNGIELTGALAPDLPATVLERRADVAAAWQRVMAAHHTAQSVRLERYPALTLTGSTGFVSGAIRRWLTGDALVWVAQAALQTPLLDSGRNQAKTDEAVATVEEQQMQHRKLVLQALREVELALSATATAKERVDLAQTEMQRRTADRSAARAALAAGVGSRPSVLQAELAELTARETIRSRQQELLLAWAGAQKALGR